ncbi:cobalt ABC transporter ATP-binding protein, partial [Lactobacillus salivarius]|nr:cobalt ABC transporter ATP-binding protein [Ligilactobacillus salivarius]
MNKLLLGRYINGNSLIHRMDPRSKLALSFYFIGIIFLANNWQTYLLLIAFTFLGVLLSKIKLSFFIRGIIPLVWLILFTVLLQVFFTNGGHVFWHWGPFTLSKYGLVNGIYVFFRF